MVMIQAKSSDKQRELISQLHRDSEEIVEAVFDYVKRVLNVPMIKLMIEAHSDYFASDKSSKPINHWSTLQVNILIQSML